MDDDIDEKKPSADYLLGKAHGGLFALLNIHDDEELRDAIKELFKEISSGINNLYYTD